MDLTIHNALHDRTLKPVNIGINDGKIKQVTADVISPGDTSIDAGGAMISPAFIEPHFHLENSVMPEYPNHSGTLGEAIKIAEGIKDKLTPEDIMRRSNIALREALLNGVLWMRDHTDVDEVAKLSLLEAVVAVRDRYQDVIDIQIVAFPQFGLADNPESVDLVWQAMEEGKIADVIILDDGGLSAAPIRDFEEDNIVKRLVSSYQSASVQTSIIDGKMVMEDRQLLTMDESEILSDGRTALADLWARKRAAETN